VVSKPNISFLIFEDTDIPALLKCCEKRENDASTVRDEILKIQLTISAFSLNLVKVLQCDDVINY